MAYLTGIGRLSELTADVEARRGILCLRGIRAAHADPASWRCAWRSTGGRMTEMLLALGDFA